MNDPEHLAEQFEAHRAHLRAVAYRMLGSLSEADDAVQEAWLRLDRADAAAVENLGGWLTIVVARVALNMLRSRTSRREEPFSPHLPEPVVRLADESNPEHEVLLEDSVGHAMQVVLDTLSPPERLAFVLHDMFAVPFVDIAAALGRSPDAARQLASRARRRVRSAPTRPAPDLARRQEVVDAFLAAAREGDFDRLVGLLHPDVVLRTDVGAPRELRGAGAVAARTLDFNRMARFGRRVLVDRAPGLLVAPHGQPFSLLAFTVADGTIHAIDVMADGERLARLDLGALES